jgi:hypothetical protein
VAYPLPCAFRAKRPDIKAQRSRWPSFEQPLQAGILNNGRNRGPEHHQYQKVITIHAAKIKLAGGPTAVRNP